MNRSADCEIPLRQDRIQGLLWFPRQKIPVLSRLKESPRGY